MTSYLRPDGAYIKSGVAYGAPPLGTPGQTFVAREEDGTHALWIERYGVGHVRLAAASSGITTNQYLIGDPLFGAADKTGAVDCTATVNAAILAAYNAGGGVIYFPTGKYLITGKITFPNTGASIPAQPSIRLTGAGGSLFGNPAATGGAEPAPTASTLDLRYNGADAKIVTLGTGFLEIDHLNFVNGRSDGTDTTPFLLTTNTTLRIHDNGFHGDSSRNGTNCNQDVIYLGGTTASAGNTTDSGFQGYGTRIFDNSFHRIRRGVYCRQWANAVTVKDNWVEQTCGSNLAHGSWFEARGFAAGVSNVLSGITVRDNTIEVAGYPHGIQFGDYCSLCSAENNNFFDPTGTTQELHYVSGTNVDQIFIKMGMAALSYINTPVVNSSFYTFRNSLIAFEYASGFRTDFASLLSEGLQTTNLGVRGILQSSPTLGGGSGVFGWGTPDVIPSSNPSGHVTYLDSDAKLKNRAASGVITVLGDGLGFAAGGGTVTQLTNKATGVTLSKVTGQITLNNASLAAGAIVSFVLTNTLIAATDQLLINHVSGGTLGAYGFAVTPASGSATVFVRNNTGGALAEAIVLQFTVIKATTS